MSHTLAVGQSFVIPQRTVTEHMLDTREEWRASLGLVDPDRELVSGQPAKILRAYLRAADRDEPAITIEVSEAGDNVTVTAVRRGYAGVDIIDEASEPMGTIDFNAFHDFYVVRAGLARTAPVVAAEA